ncbi:MAG: glutathione S-transferase family protein [Actinobacteria bacterium]|nr:glutathione S-transferase family protein [Actinomycetota bacterium]
MYTLYVIPGSHACRSAMLMLEHKGLPYRRVDFLTLLHPLAARMHGFDAGGERRSAGGRQTPGIRLGDTLGTVPGLAAGRERISTNRRIARFLDDRHPDPPLFPADPGERRAAEAAERWANETLQMAARRILGAWVVQDPAAASRRLGDGRLGYLLYRRELARRLVIPYILGRVFAVSRRDDRELLEGLRGMLDRIDAWAGDGVLGGAEPNAADLMVAPSLALILYRPDVLPLFEGRPALALVDRLLPEPAAAARAAVTA